jgi:hypothetical protein
LAVKEGPAIKPALLFALEYFESAGSAKDSIGLVEQQRRAPYRLDSKRSIII